MRKLSIIALAIFFMSCITSIYGDNATVDASTNSAPTPTYDLYIENIKVNLDFPLTFIGDESLCPLRSLADNLGFNITWDDQLQQITLSKNSDVMVMTLNSNQYTFNAVAKTATMPPQLIYDRTCVPAKLIAGEFGYHYFKDDSNYNVYIYSGNQVPNVAPIISITDNQYIKNPDSNKDISATIKYNNNTLISVQNANYTLKPSTDYIISGNTIIFKREYVRSLPAGIARLSLNFSNNSQVSVLITMLEKIYTSQSSNYSLYIDNKNILLDAPLQILDGQYGCSIRTISDGLGLYVTWDDNLQQVTFKNTDKTINMQLYALTYSVNGNEKILETPIIDYYDRMIVPIKVLADEFGWHYLIDETNSNVYIYSGNQVPNLAPIITIIDNQYIKNPDANKDIPVTIKYNNNTLYSISNEGYTLKPTTDYVINGNTILLKKEYIRCLPEGIASFCFDFSNGYQLFGNVMSIEKTYTAQTSNYSLYIDGKQVVSDSPLCIGEGQCYLAPVRAIAENLGVLVSWNEDLQQLIFETPYKTIVMQMNVRSYTTNGVKKTLEMPTILYNDRTMVPIKTLADEFEATYQEDNVNNRINLTTSPVSVTNVTDQNGQALNIENSEAVMQINLAVDCKIDNHPASFILACYGKNDTLVYTITINSTLHLGINGVIFKINQIPTDIKKIKILNWSSTLDMKPIRSTITIE